MLDTLGSLDSGATQPAPVLRIQIQSIRRPVRSQNDGQLQLCVPLMPSGCARCTSAPAAASVSAAQYHPYVASSTTLGCLPARAICLRSSAGLFVIFAVPRRRPSSVIRTSTLRRRCRSMPTTCRPSYAVSIGASLAWLETDPLHLPASAREREAPLLHRISRSSATGRSKPKRPRRSKGHALALHSARG